MQKTISRFGIIISSLLLVVGAAHAQYLVSSKAGFVNRVEGKVHIQAQGSAPDAMSRASLASQMKEGDRISTGVDSHAELLLVPGSYMRLNEKTVVEAVRTDLENTRFDVIQGGRWWRRHSCGLRHGALSLQRDHHGCRCAAVG